MATPVSRKKKKENSLGRLLPCQCERASQDQASTLGNQVPSLVCTTKQPPAWPAGSKTFFFSSSSSAAPTLWACATLHRRHTRTKHTPPLFSPCPSCHVSALRKHPPLRVVIPRPVTRQRKKKKSLVTLWWYRKNMVAARFSELGFCSSGLRFALSHHAQRLELEAGSPAPSDWAVFSILITYIRQFDVSFFLFFSAFFFSLPLPTCLPTGWSCRRSRAEWAILFLNPSCIHKGLPTLYLRRS